VWSPDGGQIAFETADAHDFPYFENSRIATVASEGGTPQVLTGSFDEDPMLIDWSPGGIYFTSQQKTSSHLFRLNPTTKAIEPLSHPAGFASSQYSFTRDYQQADFVAAGPNEYAEVYVLPLSGFEPR